jgi:hypothetical protein
MNKLQDKQYYWLSTMLNTHTRWLKRHFARYGYTDDKVYRLKDMMRLGFYLDTDKEWLNSLRETWLKKHLEN